MNQSRKIGIAVLAAAMIATPVAAQQANGSSAAKLSVSAAAAAPAQGEDRDGGYYQSRRGLFGTGSGLFIGLGAIAAIIAAILIASDVDDDDEPASP